MRINRFALALVALLGSTACDLDRQNPNAPTEEAIFGTRAGIIALAIGLQAGFGAGIDDFVYPGGLISDELGTPTGALQSYKDAELGVLSDTYDAVETPWRSHYQAIKSANDLIAAIGAGTVTLGDSTRSGILTIAYLFKAMALGELFQQYPQIIVDPQNTPAVYVDRSTALGRVLALLDSALIQFNTVRPGNEFNTQIRNGGVDVRNTILAMQARYYRIGNNWNGALAAANLVDTGVVSVMRFSDNAINPIFDLSSRAGYVRPRDTLRVVAEPGDARIAFHLTGPTVQGTYRPLRTFTQYQTAPTSIAFYWPGEVLLIRAEAKANTGDLVGAGNDVNTVRTRCGGAANQPKACLLPLLPTDLATPAQIIAEVYRQRKFELFATGLRWEDTRRLGLVSATSAFAKRCWLLYPNSQRNTDAANTPPNPSGDPPTSMSGC